MFPWGSIDADTSASVPIMSRTVDAKSPSASVRPTTLIAP